MTIKFEDLQPHVEMLIDALENKGASSSGLPDVQVYPYAQKYKEVLMQIRNKKLSKYHLDFFLRNTRDEILLKTVQKYRMTKICDALSFYFYKEFMK